MIIADGMIDTNNKQGISKLGLTGIVHYSIDKELVAKNVYNIEFWYYMKILDFWRRESSYKKELYAQYYNFTICDQNSGIPIDKNFDRLLKENIIDYLKEADKNKFKTKFNSNVFRMDSFDLINDRIIPEKNLEKFKNEFDFLNLSDSEGSTLLVNSIQKAY